MARPKIGLALGSGAARGWSLIGVIEGLAALGIVPEIVSGTSIGALVGAAFATGRLAALKARFLSWRKHDSNHSAFFFTAAAHSAFNWARMEGPLMCRGASL